MDRDRGGGFCGCLVLLLAIFGGYTLYQRYVVADAACAGGEAWARATDERMNDATIRVERLSPYSSTDREIQVVADTFKRDAEAQRSSDPPDAGRELNGEAGTFYAMLAQNAEAIAHDDPQPHDEAVLRAQVATVERLRAEVNERCG